VAGVHGFIWTGGTLRTGDDPHGIGTTTVDCLNDKGDIFGFYSVGTIVHGSSGFRAEPLNGFLAGSLDEPPAGDPAGG
jgi:hypothetical protein